MAAKEIGGYLELERFSWPMLHEGAVALNCGRNALAYVLRARGIQKIRIPAFCCDTVMAACRKEKVSAAYYAITEDWLPEEQTLAPDEWLYVVNFYGQLSNETLGALVRKYTRVIIDHAQAYFQMPLPGVDTLYTCRKFFGVADGAFLYTDCKLNDTLALDESFDRMQFVLGRFERSASEFYALAAANNEFFENEPVKRMSKLTENLLHAVDYEAVKQRRTENFAVLHQAFGAINPLRLTVPEGAFMYPLHLKNGAAVRKVLQGQKIFIPTLWPDVFDICEETAREYDLAKNILPLPCDQRYDVNDMNFMMEEIKKCLKI